MMHDSGPIMAQIGMDQEHRNEQQKFDSFEGHEGWVEMSNGYSSPQTHSPIYEHHGGEMGSIGFIHPFQQPQQQQQQHHQQQQQQQPPMGTGQLFQPQRIPQPPSHSQHQPLLPLLVMPSHPTWPSMLTNPASYATQPVSIPASAPPMSKGNTPKLPAIHATPSPRKTLTDSDRRRMCQYHEDNPSVKQTEIGALFGVERSTVSKVLRQKDKYLFPEDRSLSPVKRAKGKFPDIERALSNWAKKEQQRGIPLTDATIKEKARFFATTVGNSESHVKTNSTSWLEKFKQKNGIGLGRLTRRASETNISDSGSLNPESAGPSASQTPNGISPTSPSGLPSPSPLSATKSDEEHKSENLNSYFGQGHGAYRHSNSQSTTSLSSVYTDTGPSSFSGGPTSPTTPFTFSPDNNSGSWMPTAHSRLPLPGNQPGHNFQRPRSQTFPTLHGIDPSFISTHSQDPLTPKYNMPSTAPSSALDSPIHEHHEHHNPWLDQVSPHTLHHSSSNGSMAPPSQPQGTGLQSPPPGPSAPGSPTQDDARRALDTLLNFFNQAPTNLIDQHEYLTVLKLTEKLRLQAGSGSLPGGLVSIAEQEGELATVKIESMSAGC